MIPAANIFTLDGHEPALLSVTALHDHECPNSTCFGLQFTMTEDMREDLELLAALTGTCAPADGGCLIDMPFQIVWN